MNKNKTKVYPNLNTIVLSAATSPTFGLAPAALIGFLKASWTIFFVSWAFASIAAFAWLMWREVKYLNMSR